MRTTLASKMLLIALSFTASTLAQNDTESLSCPNHHLIKQLETGLVNSTGSVAVSFPEAYPENNADAPWHLSVLVNDTRNSTLNDQEPNGLDIAVQLYLSVSSSVRNTTACVYQFTPLNATSTGDSENGAVGCAGVFSNECAAHFQEVHQRTSRFKFANYCIMAWQTAEDMEQRNKACGNLMQVYSANHVNVTQSNCSLPIPPGAAVSESETYNTFSIINRLSPYWNEKWAESASPSQTYDLAVNQVIPFVVVGKFAQSDPPDGGAGETRYSSQMMCITPNKVVEGSSVPGDKKPWGGESDFIGNHGTKQRVGSKGSLMVAVMMAFILM